MFDFFSYFSTLAAKNKLAVLNKFYFCKVSGISGLEDAIANMQKEDAFFACDNITDGVIISKNGAYYTRYVFTVFLMKKFNHGDMDSFNSSMDVCRELRTQIYKRILHDYQSYQELTYMDFSSVLFRELDRATLAGCTGTYFMFNVDFPTDFQYQSNEWND